MEQHLDKASFGTGCLRSTRLGVAYARNVAAPRGRCQTLIPD